MINKDTAHINNLTQFIDCTISLRKSEGVPSFPINTILKE